MRKTVTTQGDRTIIKHELDPEDFGLKRGPTVGGTQKQFLLDEADAQEVRRLLMEDPNRTDIDEILERLAQKSS